MRRPLVYAFLSLTAGIFIAITCEIKKPPGWAIAGVLCSLVIFVILKWYDSEGRTTLIILSLILLGITLYGSSYFEPGNLYSRVQSLEKLRGTVTSYPLKTANGTELTLNPTNYRGRLKVFLAPETKGDIDYGDELVIEGKFEIPSRFEDFNYREYLRIKEIWGVVYQGRPAEVKPGRGNPILELGWALRKSIFDRITNIFPDRGSFLKAVLFGTRGALKDDIETWFTETGLAHLLAASGLHLGIILGISWWVAGYLGLTRETTYLISLPFLFLYLIVAGFSLPLVRASLIYLFGGAHLILKTRGVILDNWYDRYQVLAGAALILIVINPESITTVGFQLSFGATFALALFFDPIKKALPGRPGYLKGILAASLSAQLGVTPVLAIHFNRLHPWGPIVNLVAIPGVTVVLYLGILALIFGGIFPVSAGLIWCETRAIFVLRWTVKHISGIPLTSIPLPDLNPLALGSYFTLIYWFRRKLTLNNDNYVRNEGKES